MHGERKGSISWPEACRVIFELYFEDFVDKCCEKHIQLVNTVPQENQSLSEYLQDYTELALEIPSYIIPDYGKVRILLLYLQPYVPGVTSQIKYNLESYHSIRQIANKIAGISPVGYKFRRLDY